MVTASEAKWDAFGFQLLGACFVAALFGARKVRKFEQWNNIWELHRELGSPPLPMTAPWVNGTHGTMRTP